MAKTAKAAPVVEPAETEEETVDLHTKVKPLHEAHAAYIKEQTDVDVDPLAIFLVYSTRVAFRKTSDNYQEAKLAAAAAKEAEAEAKELAKAEKAKEREAKKAEKDAAKAAKAAEEEKAEKGKGKGKKTSAEELAESDAEETPAAKPAKGKAKATPKPAAKSGKKPF